MYKQKIKLFIFLFSVCAFYNSFSQITVSPTVGCVPLNGVMFTGPAGATAITWNFGDAVTSNLASPTHNYTSPGNFIVTYNATVGASPVSYTALVVVYGKPTANFTYTVPSIRCKPLNVPFTSTSTGPAAIASYTWNFGDGGQGSGPNPIWTYVLQGGFFVTLLVTDVNGCTSALSNQQGPINVSTPPTVVISSNPLALSSCTAPFSPAFSGSNCVSGSPIAGPLASYSWNFGNSQTSTQQTPGIVTYNTPGVYNVTLTVTDNNNCSASAMTPVSVSQPTLSTTIPATVCLNTPFVVGFQTNQPFTIWNFGVSSPTALTNGPGPTTSSIYPGYTSPGTYTINISAGSFPCTAVQTKTIFVEQVVANFTHTPPSYTCSPTFTAAYINQSSSNAVSYTWTATNYNGNTVSTSTLTNPTFTLVQGSLNPYTIYNTFSSLVTLVAKSANGCISTFTTHIYDSIRRPTAWFNKDKKEGCAPLVVKFRDSSFTNTSIYPITSYTWNNGGSPPVLITGNIPPPMVNPTFTYSSPGTYTPYLIIQTATGCIDTSFVDTVTVVNPPIFNFAVTPSVVCWNQPVTVSITPTSTNPVQHWHVNSDNGFFSHCINNPNPSWNFTHVGIHTFTVEGYSHSCKGTATTTQSVVVKGPIAQSRYETNCTEGTRKTVKFFSHLQDVANATLNFGDNSSVAIIGVPTGVATHSASHTYSASGNYTAILTATNGATGCSPYTYTMLVTVRDIQANFTLPSVGCANIPQTFNGSTSVDVNIGCRRGYTWYFDNFPPRDTTSAIINYTFATTGTHTVMLMVKDDNSCIDTTKHTFRISNANPTFTFNANPICLSTGTVQMLNTTSQSPDAVNNFYWDFGDASSLTTTTLTSPIHTYFSATSPSQNYSVLLVGTNSQGCIDSIRHTITVVNPVATLLPSQFLLCIPSSTANLATNTVTFTAPSAYTSYTFNYGDGSPAYTTTSNVSPPHTYTAAGSYTAVLTVNLGGCKNTGSVVISAQNYPTPNFTLNTGNVICRDSQVEFTNTSTVSSAYTLNWNLSTGGPILPLESVVWTYSASGIAIITLTVSTTPNQCAAVISKTLSILGAVANLNLDKQIVCLGNSIKFSIKNDSSKVYMWSFDYGDGSTGTFTANASPTQTVNHIYNYFPPPNGNTFVSFSYYPSSDLLKCPRTFTIPIQIIKIVADFDRNSEISKIDSVHCVNVIDQFSNQSPGSSGFNFNWGFGNGNTSTAQNPSYTYPNAGVYQVTLTITDPVNNCMGFAIKNMTINPLPSVVAFAKDTCQNAPFILNSTPTSGTAPFTYTWTPPSGIVNPNNASSIATASNSTNYTLTISDANNCKNTTTKNVNIQLPPPSFVWDTTVVIGSIVPLNNNSGSNFTYTWSPITNLSCTYCPNPISTTTANITYSVTIADNMGCFQIVNTHTVIVELKGSVDVPTAFTPNGDGTNDVIYVDGWGIKKLNYFRIFNRWGQLLFESNDIKMGWDGMFNGVPQNLETYVYQVSAELYVGDGKPFLKTGTFKLIR
ncbi:MAG: PKD domain-containing protein [Bacteroidota bacterium]|nr:PKD domain-containing protein [Bacteroidota bacterium]